MGLNVWFASAGVRTVSSATYRKRMTSTHRDPARGRAWWTRCPINNASDLGPTPLALLADTECEDLERALATNFLAPFRLTKALPWCTGIFAREGRGAVVLNVSSDAAVNPYSHWGAYGAKQSNVACT